MASHQMNWLDVLNHLVQNVHAMLDRNGLRKTCLVCESESATVCDILLEHEEFCLTLPLPVCTRCSKRKPFRRESSLSRWWTRATLGAFSSVSAEHGEQRPSDHVSLRQLLSAIPEYKLLTEFVPNAQVSSAARSRGRGWVANTEASQFIRSLQMRRWSSFLMDDDDLRRSGVPFVVLQSFVDIIDTMIKQVVAEVSLADEYAIRVDALLLPGRSWRCYPQVVLGANRNQQTGILSRLREVLGALPTWPVAYPVVFLAGRCRGVTVNQLEEQLKDPFPSWANLGVPGQSMTYGEMALRVYSVVPPEEPLALDEEDCLALRSFLSASIELQLFHAALLRALEKYQSALEIYEGLISSFPEETTIAYERIDCLAEAGQLERAAAECQKRITIAPTEAACHARLATLQSLMGSPAAALQTIEAALSHVETAEYVQIRGTMLAELGRFAEAKSATNLAIFRDHDHAAAYLLRAKLHLNEGSSERALIDLGEYHRCGGITLESLQLQAATLVSAGRTAEAGQAYRSAIEMAPQHPLLRLQWAEFLAQNGKYESGREACGVVLEQDPQFGSAYAVRAAILLDLEQFDEAIADAEHAIELGVDGPRTLLTKSLASAALGRVVLRQLHGINRLLQRTSAVQSDIGVGNNSSGMDCQRPSRRASESPRCTENGIKGSQRNWMDAAPESGRSLS